MKYLFYSKEKHERKKSMIEKEKIIHVQRIKPIMKGKENVK